MTGRLAIRDKRRVARRIQLLRKVILKMCRGRCGWLLLRLGLLCGLLLLSAAGALLRPMCAQVVVKRCLEKTRGSPVAGRCHLWVADEAHPGVRACAILTARTEATRAALLLLLLLLMMVMRLRRLLLLLLLLGDRLTLLLEGLLSPALVRLPLGGWRRRSCHDRACRQQALADQELLKQSR